MADTKINGALFQSMVTEGALAITEQKEQINELNVFPVPDGDTRRRTAAIWRLRCARA